MAKTPKTRNEAAAILYVRVSALESQSKSEIGLDGQERTLRAMAAAAGYTDLRVVVERHTASKTQPALEAALKDLAKGEAVALYVDKVDRLTRSGMGDAIRIADLADRHGWRLVIGDIGGGVMDTGSVAGRIVLGVMAEIARQESKRRSERMRAFHAERRAKGLEWGTTHPARKTTASPEAVAMIYDARAEGLSWQAVAARLNDHQMDNRKWYPTAVRRVYASPSAAAMLAA